MCYKVLFLLAACIDCAASFRYRPAELPKQQSFAYTESDRSEFVSRTWGNEADEAHAPLEAYHLSTVGPVDVRLLPDGNKSVLRVKASRPEMVAQTQPMPTEEEPMRGYGPYGRARSLYGQPTWFMEAAKFVNGAYYSKPYPGCPKSLSKELKFIWYDRNWKAVCKDVERPMHGLANALRKAILVPSVAKAYHMLYTNNDPQRSKESFAFSAEDLRAMQLASMFEDAGRRAEIEHEDDPKTFAYFLNKSVEAFSSYASSVDFISEQGKSLLMSALFAMHTQPDMPAAYPFKVVLQRARELDLMIRTHDRLEHNELQKAIATDLAGGSAGRHGGLEAANELIFFAEKLVRATGDIVEHDKTARNCKKFGACKSVNRCLNALKWEPQPSLINEPAWLLKASEAVYEYFKVPYPEAPEDATPEEAPNGLEALKMVWKRRWAPVCGVPRPNHALPNAVRKAVLIPVVIQAYQRYYNGGTKTSNPKKSLTKSSWVFTPAAVRAMQVGIMFEAVGRQSEIGWGDSWPIYESFRLTSLAALTKFVEENFSGDQDMKHAISAFNRMYMSPHSRESHPFKIMFEKAHDLELIRCWEKTQSEKKIDQLALDLGSSKEEGKTIAHKLALYTEELMLATGDNVQYRPSGGTRAFWDCKLFRKAGHNITKLFAALRDVAVPDFGEDSGLLGDMFDTPTPSLSMVTHTGDDQARADSGSERSDNDSGGRQRGDSGGRKRGGRSPSGEKHGGKRGGHKKSDSGKRGRKERRLRGGRGRGRAKVSDMRESDRASGRTPAGKVGRAKVSDMRESDRASGRTPAGKVTAAYQN